MQKPNDLQSAMQIAEKIGSTLTMAHVDDRSKDKHHVAVPIALK